MYEKDYFKRLIKSICKMTAALVLGKDAIESNIEKENFSMKLSEDDLLEIMVKKYISEGNLNKAENIIFETMHKHNTKRVYDIALDFYNCINNFTDNHLKACNFSRKEITDGLKDIQKIRSNT